MKQFSVILAAAGLAICAIPCARANSALDVPRIDASEVAKAAELKGDLARVHNDYSLAVAHYKKAVRANPKNATLLNKLGISELKLNDRGAARKYFNLAVKYDPGNVSALNNLGAVSFLNKKFKPAVRYFKQALELDESSAPAHLNLAEAWLAMGEVDRSMIEYARALELDADILTDRQDGISAQITTPEQRARVSYMIAKAYAKRGNLEGALEYLKRAKDGRFDDLGRVYKDQEFAALWPDPRLGKIVKP
jgi:tetratricopeptide (TPR) repeat protein